MPNFVLIHSFRRGVGKSSIIANVAALLAYEGHRIGIIDASIHSPSRPSRFNLNENGISYSLHDYLWGKCDITQAVHEITQFIGTDVEGQVFFVPASSQAFEVAKVSSYSDDIEFLNAGFEKLTKEFRLDLLLIDSPSGLNEEVVSLIAISDILLLLMLPNQQDYQNTGIVIDVARKLNVARIMLIVNEMPEDFDFDNVKTETEQLYNCEVAAILPYINEMTALDAEIFALKYPTHPVTIKLKHIATKLVTESEENILNR